MKWVRRHRWSLLGWGVWLVGVVGAFLVPPEYARLYATIWAGATALVSLGLVVAYVAFSRPSRGEDGHRHWFGEWQWFGALTSLFALVFANQFLSRVTLPAPDTLTDAYVRVQTQSAITGVSSFVVMSWVAILWVRRHVRARRASKGAK